MHNDTKHPPDHFLIDRYHIPISRASYPEVRHLINSGVLQQAESDHEYEVTSGTEVNVPTDQHMVIGQRSLRADMYRLPSYAYAALTQYNATATYPALNDLWQLMQARASQTEVTAAVRDCVATGRRSVSQPLLIQPNPRFRAAWVPERTLVREKWGEYQVSLAFTAAYLPDRNDRRKTAVGLDLGLQPMTTAYDHDGQVTPFYIGALTLPDQRLLSDSERAVVDQIIYATGRVASQQVVTHLVSTSGRVYAEKLRLADMATPYRRRARAAAIHDHNWAWLPQALHRAGIGFTRVPSGHTSVECPRCGSALPGNREGSRFHCLRCSFSADAHVIAAANVLRRGLRSDSIAQRLYPWPVPPHAKQ